MQAFYLRFCRFVYNRLLYARAAVAVFRKQIRNTSYTKGPGAPDPTVSQSLSGRHTKRASI